MTTPSLRSGPRSPFRFLLPAAWLCLALAAPAASLGQGGAASSGEIADIVSDHKLWLTGLGEPKFLDAAGIDSGYIPEGKMRDPRRAHLAGRKLAGLDFPGIVLRAGALNGIDLSGANLPGGDFSHAALERADFSSANLEHANLMQARLKHSTLTGANLAGADLADADLTGARLSGADLSGANLREATLRGADLTGANLSGANLSGADLTQARLAGANLEQANLSGAQLIESDLRGASLKLADLSDAQLFGAVLDDAFLFDTNLSGADLSGASLRGIDLFSSKLAGTELDGVDLTGVVFEPSPAYAEALMGNVDAIARAENLGLMTFYSDSRPLENLQRELRKAGYHRQELRVTYALRRGLRQQAIKDGSLATRLAGVLQFVFLEFPIEYGASPYRPLIIISFLVFVFGFVYMIPLVAPSERFGRIWKVSPRGHFFRSGGAVKEEVVVAGRPRGLLIAFWFSFLSAFNIGGRMFNLDDLFIHCQTEEFHLHGTRWVRAISGAQALISVYLFVLMLLVFLEKVAF